jgi:hypothetical protein
MNKRLLKPDYQKIIRDCFTLPECDFYNYYLNIIEENYSNNTDIIERLKAIINEWKEWYYSQVYRGEIITVKIDEEYHTIHSNQTFTRDETGKIQWYDLSEMMLPLYPYGIEKHVNKAFFDNHLELLQTIEELLNIRNEIIKFENNLPEPINTAIRKIPFALSFDVKDIKSRLELLDHMPNVIEYYKTWLYDYMEKSKIKSFKCEFPDEQLNRICKELINKEYINQETTLEQFRAVFTAQSIVNIKPIKWTLLTIRKEPHKTAFRDFLSLMTNETIKQNIVNSCFTDNQGNTIKLAKPKKNEKSRYYKKLCNIVK